MKQYHIVSRVAIYLLAVVMILSGIFHLTNVRDLVVYIPPSIPGGNIWVYFVGIAYILSGISFILNKWVKFAGYILAILLFIIVIVIHLPDYLCRCPPSKTAPGRKRLGKLMSIKDYTNPELNSGQVELLLFII